MRRAPLLALANRKLSEVSMTPPTIFLSRLIGLFAVLFALCMALQRQSVTTAAMMLFRDPALLLLFGMIALIAGLAMVLSHNVWSGGAAPIVVTLMGWILVIRGVALLALPAPTIMSLFEFFHFEDLFYLYVAMILALGAFLTYSGFKPPRSPIWPSRP
jgi:hypothetical protein